MKTKYNYALVRTDNYELIYNLNIKKVPYTIRHKAIYFETLVDLELYRSNNAIILV
jgi:hypothetical protein